MLVGNSERCCRRRSLLDFSGCRGLQRLMGLLDGQASRIEEITVQEQTKDQYDNNPFADNGMFEAFEDGVEDLSADVAAVFGDRKSVV